MLDTIADRLSSAVDSKPGGQGLDPALAGRGLKQAPVESYKGRGDCVGYLGPLEREGVQDGRPLVINAYPSHSIITQLDHPHQSRPEPRPYGMAGSNPAR